MSTEQELQSFIDSHVSKVKPLMKDANIAYFDAITTGDDKYYKKYEELSLEIEKIYNDKEGFEKLKEFKKNIEEIKKPLLKRQLNILYNSYLGSQGDISLLKEIIELSSKIEKNFNIYRAKIDGKEYTDNEIKDILRKENDSKKLEIAWSASKKQGEIVEKDLIFLIKLRNKLALSLGFKNYYEMSMTLSEQNPKEIEKLFLELDELTKKPFEKLKREMDEVLSKRYKINIHELNPWHYHDLFFQEAPEIYKIDLDKYYENQDTEQKVNLNPQVEDKASALSFCSVSPNPIHKSEGFGDVIEIAKDFYNNLGLNIDNILEKSDLYEKSKKYQHACCMDIDREGDIRIVESVKNNEKWMDTTLHELGHAAYDKYLDKNLPYMLKHAAHIFTTEAIALLFGRFASNPDFMERYCGISLNEKKKISETLDKILRLQKLVFSRWSQVMLNFEKSIYENPAQDLNKLWWNLVKKYQLLDFSRDKPDWASKIHISSSPVYYHNYLLGDLLASQIKAYVNKNIILKDETWIGNKKVGEYLREKIFFSGKSFEWNEMIKRATEELLTARHFAEEFCG
ncbi:MAG: M2 family metallopeptidase [Nanoarchaeota archaeon]